ncbi:hypothetical protein BD410DRAFT_150392 [Rickenella mellea]|uniref:Malate dehydrogenase n=1 Tax=Rickenella mellea TaxID=50990 RepID=A0A4Y7Q802_9AGAM|nr:hypothetical protein BD410DRAFT_150392 [Rickenella mellea]
MLHLLLIAAATLLLSFSEAAPTSQRTRCDVSKVPVPLPSNQDQLQIAAGTVAQYIALGVGVQNYTCGSAGSYTSSGAVAELFDISCFAVKDTSTFETMTDDSYQMFNRTNVSATKLITMMAASESVLGQHVFVTNPVTGTGISPQFDFRSASRKDDPNAYVIASKVGNIAAPTGKQDVDWLSLMNARGSLSTQILRLNTRGGQPPSHCQEGSTISVKYTAQYWFYG